MALALEALSGLIETRADGAGMYIDPDNTIVVSIAGGQDAAASLQNEIDALSLDWPTTVRPVEYSLSTLEQTALELRAVMSASDLGYADADPVLNRVMVGFFADVQSSSLEIPKSIDRQQLCERPETVQRCYPTLGTMPDSGSLPCVTTG